MPLAEALTQAMPLRRAVTVPSAETLMTYIDMDQDELKSILGSGDVAVILSVNP